MDNQNKKLSFKLQALISVAIFILAFLVSLVVWVYTPLIFTKLYLPPLLESPIVSYYGELIAQIATYIITFIKDVQIIEIIRNNENISIGLIPANTGLTEVIKTTIDVSTSNYAFNVPLSLAIMAAFYPFLQSKWIYLEALAILIIVHILFVFSLEGYRLTQILTLHGYEEPNSVTQIFWEFLWGFVDNMVVRFEPFLIGAYLFLMRNREKPKKVVPEKVPQQNAVYRKKKPKRKR
ncbi:MAG: hypothetical protein WBB48_05685 [Thermodesulfobacteriota bacterium]